MEDLKDVGRADLGKVRPKGNLRPVGCPCAARGGQLTDRQGPAPLVTVATSDTIPGTVKLKPMASTGTSAIAVSV